MRSPSTWPIAPPCRPRVGGGTGAIDILIHNVGERDRRPFLDIEP